MPPLRANPASEELRLLQFRGTSLRKKYQIINKN
jgi:hypothetical protein